MVNTIQKMIDTIVKPLFYDGPTLADDACNSCQIMQITSHIRYEDKIDNPYKQVYDNATFEDVMKVCSVWWSGLSCKLLEFSMKITS